MADNTLDEAARKAKRNSYLAMWRIKNAAKLKAYSAAYYVVNRDAIKRRAIEWDEKNPERRASTSRKYYLSNRERIIEYQRYYAENSDTAKARKVVWRRNKKPSDKIWRSKNRDRINAIHQRRRARKRGSYGHYTAQDVQDILAAQKYRCAYCQIKIRKRYCVDHILPLAKGGSNGRRNIQLTCQPCNQRKHAKDPILFAQSLGLLI